MFSEYKVNIGFILHSFLSNETSWLMKIFTCVSTIKISYMDRFYFPLHRKSFDSRFFVESHIACLLRLCVCSDTSFCLFYWLVYCSDIDAIVCYACMCMDVVSCSTITSSRWDIRGDPEEEEERWRLKLTEGSVFK